MRINHNISSMVGQGSLFQTGRKINKNLERLSTGLRVNRASDDAAGLAISEKMRTQVRGTKQAKRNALDGISALNIAEGASNEISAIIQRMRELAIQASTDTYTDTDRGYTQQEFDQLRSEIDRIASVTSFNGRKVLQDDGTSPFASTAMSGALLWVDANDKESIDALRVNTADLCVTSGATGLDVISGSDLSSQTGAVAAITALDTALGSVNKMRADVGAYVNRLESAINNLTVSNVNQQAAESQIRDVDFAYESAQFSKNQILSQSATSMLAQANAKSQGVLSLIQG